MADQDQEDAYLGSSLRTYLAASVMLGSIGACTQRTNSLIRISVSRPVTTRSVRSPVDIVHSGVLAHDGMQLRTRRFITTELAACRLFCKCRSRSVMLSKAGVTTYNNFQLGLPHSGLPATRSNSTHGGNHTAKQLRSR